MGLLSFLFRREPKVEQLEDGLSYRMLNPRKAEITIAPDFVESYCVEKRIDPDDVRRIKRLNIVCTLANNIESYAVMEVLNDIALYCHACGGEVFEHERKCDDCGAKLWKGPPPLEIVIVRA